MTSAPELIVALDCGTSAAKAVAWGDDGVAQGEGRAEIATDAPAPGFAEQEPEDWWHASCQAIAACVETVGSSHVAALAITFQRETFALLDAAGAPVRPAILWHDGRATEELAELQTRLDPAAYHRATGKQLDITAAVAKLAWLSRHEPVALARASQWVDVPAYLASRLTGRAATVACGVDTTGLVALASRSWRDAAVPEHLVLPDILPRPGVVGRLNAAAATACGLSVGTPVVVAGGDGHCFSVGARAAGGDRAAATLTLGTSAVLGIAAARPLLDDAFRTLLACGDDGYLLESVIQCGSATVSWFDDVFAASSGRSTAVWDRACAEVPAGSRGLLVLPHWRGQRVPHNDPLARGVVVGWTDAHDEAAFRRAILEGIALEVAQLLAVIRSVGAPPVSSLVVGGGGARADLWCQILADVLRVSVCRPSTVESASLGAAICARAALSHIPLRDAMATVQLAADRFDPGPDATVYARLKPVFADLYAACREANHALAEIISGECDAH
jgi:xylulokinase